MEKPGKWNGKTKGARTFNAKCVDCGGDVVITVVPQVVETPGAQNKPVRITRLRNGEEG